MPNPHVEPAESASHLLRAAEKVVTEIGNRNLAAARTHAVQARDALQRLGCALILELQIHGEADHPASTLSHRMPMTGPSSEDGQDGPGSHRRVLMSDVDRVLGLANLMPLPRLAPPDCHGLKLGQMNDVVVVRCGASSETDRLALRDRARRALRGGGFIVKDSPQTTALLYVVGIL